MKIISVADIFFAKLNTIWIFVNLRLTNGIEGWGEATLNKKEKLIYELAKIKLPQFVGLSLNELSLKLKVDCLLDNVPNAVFYSAVNSAFIDLIAKMKYFLGKSYRISEKFEIDLY